MSYLKRAKDLFEDAKAFRRKLHQHPEVGFDLPETSRAVKEKLDQFGIDYQSVGETDGITGTLGDPAKGKTLLLRADMDGLPITEKSEHDFVSENENGHLCGHDLHTTILLMTLKMLKEDEDQLDGQIKFLFQPAEETLNGGRVMLEEGILEDPKPDAGMAVHMWPLAEEMDVEIASGPALASALNFKITVKGVGAHGAMPFNGVDPVYVGTQIVDACNGIIARELPSNRSASLSMGRFESQGGTVNIIPDTVVIEGTSRSLYTDAAEHVAKRLPEVVEHIAKAHRAEAEFEVTAEVPRLYNTEEITSQVLASAKEALGEDYPVKEIGSMLASEDYAHIASELPESCYFFIGCPLENEDGETFAVHHPLVQFNEDALFLGSSSLATAASNWLKDNK